MPNFAHPKTKDEMEDTKHIQIKDFNYELPDGRIAKFPLPERDRSKLLVYRHGEVAVIRE